jgi:hypothetical protein
MEVASEDCSGFPGDLAVHFHLSDVELAERFASALNEIARAPEFDAREFGLAEAYASALSEIAAGPEIDIHQVELAERYAGALERIAELQGRMLSEGSDKAVVAN